MKHARKFAFLSALAAIGLFAGCTNPTSGIFYTLENETDLNNSTASGLTKDCTAGGFETLGSNYVALVGTTLYSNPVPAASTNGVVDDLSTKWTAIPAPDATHPACTDLAVAGSYLYAIYTGNNSASSATTPALYYASDIPSAASSWTAISLSSGQLPSDLFANAVGRTVLQTFTPPSGSAAANSYNLYILSGAGSLASITGFGTNWRPVTAIAGPDASTMLVTGDTVYTADLSSGAPALTLRTAPTGPTSGTTTTLSNYKTLAWAGGNTFYLASYTGFLAKTADSGATWTVSAAVQTNANSTVLKFTTITWISSLPNKSTGNADDTMSNLLLAGTAGQGLWLITTSDMSATPQPAVLTDNKLWGGDYPSANQSLATVSQFFPTAGNRIFIGTASKGLWSAINNSISTKSGLFFRWE